MTMFKFMTARVTLPDACLAYHNRDCVCLYVPLSSMSSIHNFYSTRFKVNFYIKYASLCKTFKNNF